MLKGGGNFKELLSGVDLSSIAPLLTTFGINDSIVKLISSDEVKSLLNGNLDLKTLLPLVMNLASSFSPQQTESAQVSPERLDPIKDVATSQIYSTLGNYFES